MKVRFEISTMYAPPDYPKQYHAFWNSVFAHDDLILMNNQKHREQAYDEQRLIKTALINMFPSIVMLDVSDGVYFRFKSRADKASFLLWTSALQESVDI